MNREPITSLKGIGEKTGELFKKLGVDTVEDLLHYYPRAYDAYEEPVPIGQLTEGGIAAVTGQLLRTASVRRFKNMQIIVTTVKDMTGTLQLTWYNMPYLCAALQMGRLLVFRGRVVKKGGRLTMEQPEIFEPEAYAAISQRLFKFTANSLASLYMETPILLPTLTIRVSDDAMLPWERHCS